MLNQQHDEGTDAADVTGRAARGDRTLYARPMPGGGYVKVELMAGDHGAPSSERRRGRVVIEPRAAPRRGDNVAPLVVEDLEGENESAVIAELFRIARDNAAIARRVLCQRTMRRRAD